MEFYVINLDRAKERMHHIRDNLDRHAIPFRRISAIDGSKLSDHQVRECTTWACRHFLCTPSMIGCALSHRIAWNEIASLPDSFYVILEDDVEWTKDTTQGFVELSRLVHARGIHSSDICIINCCSHPMLNKDTWTPDKNLELIHAPLINSCTACYLVTPAAARELLKYHDKVTWHVDIVMYLGGLRKYCWKTSHCLVNNIGIDPETSFNLSDSSMPMMTSLLPINLRFCLQTTVFALNLTPINVSLIIVVFLLLLSMVLPTRYSVLLFGYVVLECTCMCLLNR